MFFICCAFVYRRLHVFVVLFCMHTSQLVKAAILLGNIPPVWTHLDFKKKKAKLVPSALPKPQYIWQSKTKRSYNFFFPLTSLKKQYRRRCLYSGLRTLPAPISKMKNNWALKPGSISPHPAPPLPIFCNWANFQKHEWSTQQSHRHLLEGRRSFQPLSCWLFWPLHYHLKTFFIFSVQDNF